MKLTSLVPSAVLAVLLATGCNKKSPDVAKQLAELERKAAEATERQQELEQQLEDQKLAAERDAIERERMEIEETRAELERQQGDATEAEAEKLRERELLLAAREGKVEAIQSTLEEKEDYLQQRDDQLSERDRELAGREALISENDNDDEDTAPVGDYGMFYDSLSPYGSWFETADYGYVWQPVIVRDIAWRPYTRGRWACTDRGWTWISDEPFGWATYHYGRWALCRGYGWVWVPGSEWAPSWVCWRTGGSHIGWAPLPPETLAYRRHHWDSSVDVTYGIGASWYCFVETRNFGHSIHQYCLPYHQNQIYIGQTINITNIHVRDRHIICGGPSYGDVARQTVRKPPFYRIEEDRHGRPGRDPLGMRPKVEGNRLRVAAPNLDVAWNDSLKPDKIKGRMESVKLERQEELRPEVSERFRQTREESRRKADQSIAEMGGKEKFNQQRLEQLDQNRRRVEETKRTNEKSRDSRPRIEEGKVAGKTEQKPEQPVKREDTPKIVAPKDRSQVTDEARERIRKQREEAATQPGKREDGPRIVAPKDRSQVTDEAMERVRKQREEAATQPGKREDGPRIVAPRDRSQVTDEAMERIRKQREEAATQPGKREDGPRFTPPAGGNKQVQDDSSARMRKQQEDQAEQTRQQQQEAQQQREQARLQQIEEARREQARLQQQEAAQRQREQARQEQMEESRREQARQQQQEESRREQARQEQMEESRREQSRQQQQEESRRQQQQQQEESRREQARQQQQESERQQERARQEKDNEERQRGGRNR